MKTLTRVGLMEMNRLLVFATLAAVLPASGATFNVNSQVDTVDAAPGNGICADSGGHCTLRAAVMEANATAILDNINVPAITHVLTLGQLNITSNMNIKGANKTTTIIDAKGKSRVFKVNQGKVVQISTLTVRNGLVLNEDGGCIRNAGQLALNAVIVNGCKVVGNVDFGFRYGGGIANFGQLTVHDSQVTHNTISAACEACNGYGGGLSNYSDALLSITRTIVDSNLAVPGGEFGGGVVGGVFSFGNLDISESTFTRNRGTIGAILSSGSVGPTRIAKSIIANNIGESGPGGIANYSNSAMTLINCTISGNHGSGTQFSHPGAGVYNGATMRVLNSTITGNQGDIDAVGGINSDFGSLSIRNSIIARNTAPGTPDCGSITSLTYSLIGNTTGCTVPAGVGNLLNVNPMLGPLANNGGPTQTRALLTGSVALDSASPAPVGSGGNSCEKIDQRGVARPQNGRCDMGAYERRLGVPHFSDDQEAGADRRRLALSSFEAIAGRKVSICRASPGRFLFPPRSSAGIR